MFDRSPFIAQRQRFFDYLRTRRAAALIPGGVPKLRNGDSEHRFRVESDFWYLTGFAEPHCTLLLLPGLADGAEDQAILFLREKKPEEEVWTGKRLGLEKAPELLGVSRAFPSAEWSSRLSALLLGYERLCYRSGQDEARDRAVLGALAALRNAARGAKPVPTELFDTAEGLHELRLFKSPAELAWMREAARITAAAHLAAMGQVAQARNECEIDALLSYEFRRRGAWASAYNNIVAGGANACTLHYNDNDAPLEQGRLLLIDAGAEYMGYACDVTRTLPIGGRFSDEQRALYEIVLGAQAVGIAACTTASRFDDVHTKVVDALARGLSAAGVFAGDAAEIVSCGQLKALYMHRTSHWLGLDVHDAGKLAHEGLSRRLEPGMVLTVEPGLYVRPGEPSVDPRWHGIGIRIEDDVLVTAGAPEVLTAAIPKSVNEVEAACGAARVQRPSSAAGGSARVDPGDRSPMVSAPGLEPGTR